MPDTRPCALVPVYDHPTTVTGVCQRLERLGLPVILVDDGSGDVCARVLDALHRQGHALVRHAINRGKGAALRSGLYEAQRLGYTHALQVDADAQHDMQDLPAFLTALEARPDTLFVGYPRYDDSVPRARLYGRYATHVWVWINTLSLAIRDTMCGVRVYPVATVNRLLTCHDCGDRMTFDTEILVRWHWAGHDLVNLPVKVHYPENGVSHFALWRDNRQISLMHAKLFIGMLWRAPLLLRRRWRATRVNIKTTRHVNARTKHWASMRERGTLGGMLLLVRLRRWLGSWPFRVVLWPVMLWYFLTHGTARRASTAYLQHLDPSLTYRPMRLFGQSFRHFLSFGDALMDKVDAWSGQIARERLTGPGIGAFESAAAQQAGGLILVAHHGNLDVVNALTQRRPQLDLTVMMHTRNAEKFNELLESASGIQRPNVIEVSEITPGTAQQLARRIEAGGFIVIAADRLPLSSRRTRAIDFLGEPADFPEGPFHLAALLRCRTYYLSCIRDERRFIIDFIPLESAEALPRRDRHAWIGRCMQRYADALAAQVRRAPLQWFNFFPSWEQDREPDANPQNPHSDARCENRHDPR